MNLEHTFSVSPTYHSSLSMGEDPLARLHALTPEGTTLFFVTDDTCAGLFGEHITTTMNDLGRPFRLYQFGEGEKDKQLEAVHAIARFVLDNGGEPDDMIVGFGGGITTDLAGFAASIIKRGLSWAALPTTLMGAVDAAIGGKTGCNTIHGKNQLGALWLPRFTILSRTWLKSLDRVALLSGWAEMIKVSVMGDRELFEQMERAILQRGLHLPETSLIWKAALLKLRFVGDDLHDVGSRRALNFGHTMGHALESASQGALPHGLAVAQGMVYEARLATSLSGFPMRDFERLAHLLRAAGFPLGAPPPMAQLYPYLRHDKKRRGGELAFALPRAIGEGVKLCHPPTATLYEVGS